MNNKADKLQPLFDLIDLAGGPKLPNIRSLDFGKRGKVSMNMWAFFFCFFYYLYHGMWKKGVVLQVISIVLILLVDHFFPAVSNITFTIPAVFFGTRANVDLYKKYKLSDDGWI